MPHYKKDPFVGPIGHWCTDYRGPTIILNAFSYNTVKLLNKVHLRDTESVLYSERPLFECTNLSMGQNHSVLYREYFIQSVLYSNALI